MQKRVAAGVLSAGHARALLSLDNPEAQDRLASRIVAEGLSVRAVEEIVSVGSRRRSAPARGPAPRSSRRPLPACRHLADRLSDLFETRVKVEMGQRKGKIVVEFATVDDLERIVKAMAPGAPAAHRRTSGKAGSLRFIARCQGCGDNLSARWWPSRWAAVDLAAGVVFGYRAFDRSGG